MHCAGYRVQEVGDSLLKSFLIWSISTRCRGMIPVTPLVLQAFPGLRPLPSTAANTLGGIPYRNDPLFLHPASCNHPTLLQRHSEYLEMPLPPLNASELKPKAATVEDKIDLLVSNTSAHI